MKQGNRDAQQPPASPVPAEIQHLLDGLKAFRAVEVDLSVELGRCKLKIRDLLALRHHSVFELDNNAGSKLNLYVNGVLLGRGEPIVLGDRIGIKIDEIVETED